jgi:hypothetical protein
MINPGDLVKWKYCRHHKYDFGCYITVDDVKSVEYVDCRVYTNEHLQPKITIQATVDNGISLILSKYMLHYVDDEQVIVYKNKYGILLSI